MNGIPKITNGFSALQSAELGIRRGLDGLDRNAQTIAHAAVEPESFGTDVTAALVDNLEQKLLVQLNARMMSAADESLGTILDVKA